MTKKPQPPTTPNPAPSATEGERIAKVLSRAGVASRREAERMITAGEVTVNGKVIDSPALNVLPSDRITVSGHPIGQPEPARLWLYYKPEGLVTSEADEKGRATVFENLPEDMPRVMSIGRLDLNSEGLLLLTNDGELKRRLELPSTGWLRKYRVRIKGNPTDPELDPLRKGITVDGEQFQPMQVMLDRHQGANAWLTIGLREGKNREIRRAMAEIGLTVNRLIRISYGPFRLNELQPGDVEEVRPKVLRDQLGLSGDAADDAPARRMTRNARSGGSDADTRRPAAPRRDEGGPTPRRFGTATKPRGGDADSPTRQGMGRRTEAETASPARAPSAKTRGKAQEATPRPTAARRGGSAEDVAGPRRTAPSAYKGAGSGPETAPGPRRTAAPSPKPAAQGTRKPGAAARPDKPATAGRPGPAAKPSRPTAGGRGDGNGPARPPTGKGTPRKR